MTVSQSKASGKELWLECALNLLDQGTVNDVSVEALSRQLGIAKSSFYWHFKDRKSFLEELLNYWSEQFHSYTSQDESLLISPNKDALEAVIINLSQQRIMRYDLAMRAWAQTDEAVMEHVKFVYQQRLNFIRHVFEAMGYQGEDLECRTQLFVTYFSWQPYMFIKEAEPRSEQRDKNIISLLLSPAVDLPPLQP